VATPSRADERSWCWRHAAPQFAGPRGNPSTRRCAARWRRAEPWALEYRPSSRGFSFRIMVKRVCPGRPHPSVPRPRPRRGNARRAGLRRRVVRSSGTPGSRPSSRGVIFLQVWAGGSPGSSSPQRVDPGSPRHRTDDVAVASRARYASRRQPLPRGPVFGKACRPEDERGGDPPTRTPAR
jgi:hypothetical protein